MMEEGTELVEAYGEHDVCMGLTVDYLFKFVIIGAYPRRAAGRAELRAG